MRSFVNFSPSTHPFFLVVKCSMCKNAINTNYLFRLSQFSPPKINENFQQLPPRFLPGVEVLITSVIPHAEARK